MIKDQSKQDLCTNDECNNRNDALIELKDECNVDNDNDCTIHSQSQ